MINFVKLLHITKEMRTIRMHDLFDLHEISIVSHLFDQLHESHIWFRRTVFYHIYGVRTQRQWDYDNACFRAVGGDQFTKLKKSEFI